MKMRIETDTDRSAAPRRRKPRNGTIKRRLAMAAAVTLPLTMQAMADESDLVTGAAAGPVIKRALQNWCGAARRRCGPSYAATCLPILRL